MRAPCPPLLPLVWALVLLAGCWDGPARRPATAGPPAASPSPSPAPPPPPPAPSPPPPSPLPALSPAPSPSLSPSPSPAPPAWNWLQAGDVLIEADDAIPAEAVEVAAVGDVNLSERIGRLIAANGSDYPWRAVAGPLGSADLAVANLECAASTLGSPAPRTWAFRADPATLPAMAAAGVDAASVANNHALDYGPEAFVDTVANLRSAGIEPVGGGADRAAAYAPAVFERKGRRVAVMAASRVVPPGWAAGDGSPGMATAYDTGRLLGAVRAARAAADAVVVMVHWGTEGSALPDPEQVRLAHRLVDAGATAVLGSHPHVLQPAIRYGNAVIAYSLGNFVFSPPAGEEPALRSHILRVGLLPSGGVAVARIPVRISNGQPRPG